MPSMVLPSQNPCRLDFQRMRVVSSPILPLPPNHLLMYCLCPCGRHRMHFAMPRDLLPPQMEENEPILPAVRALPHLQRLAEMQLYARSRRRVSRKRTEALRADNEDVDR
ncbi:hypothetical protein KM043_010187 [Ampulex compressa]|nr:hypothetical protein KM043_010187 [Ampulex compressa]